MRFEDALKKYKADSVGGVAQVLTPTGHVTIGRHHEGFLIPADTPEARAILGMPEPGEEPVVVEKPPRRRRAAPAATEAAEPAPTVEPEGEGEGEGDEETGE